MPSELLSFARYYLERNLHPIPVEPRGKRPLVKWQKYQQTPPTDVELTAWFDVDPAPNIGLILGRGIIAVDLDGPGAEDLLVKAGIELPESAPRTRTGNGFHVFLKVNEPLGDRIALLAAPSGKPAVDIRGVGFVVAPPSIHPSGHVYEWILRPDTLPDAPGALISLIKAPRSLEASESGQAPKWVSEALRGVGEGRRDATCARLAGYFLSKNLPEDVVRETLYSFADRCDPKLPRSDVDKTVKSVARKAAQSVGEAGPVQDEPFQVLGYNQGSYFYLPRGARQVVELRARDHTKLHMLSLAPMAYWERAYPGTAGPRWELGANAMMRKAEAVGIHDIGRVRGRGAWWDDDAGGVLHLGDTLIAGGKQTPILDVPPGRYIYEAAAPMPLKLGDPLEAPEAHRLLEICELVSWERPISAKLLAGWVTVAPICGALSWRPHIWLTGPAGSGKTWVLDHIVRYVVGSLGLAVQSETTEAGLRQTLGHDARPVIFDEAEGENDRAQVRIQNILALMRQASSETGAIIIKGSTSGIAKTYRIRSCFAFSSIGVGLQQYADTTRVSVLELRSEEDRDLARRRFSRLSRLVTDTLTDDWLRRFHARSIELIPVIRSNARTFAAAGAEVIGSQRLGDQIGALLAGCYALHNDGEITSEQAREWVAAQDWSEQAAVQDGSDEQRCLQRILEHVVRVQVKHFNGERSVGELIRRAALKREDDFDSESAHGVLNRLGIRVERDAQGDVFMVSSSHRAIADMLDSTPWAKSWARALRRLPGAQAERPVRFAGSQSRAVSLPLGMIS